ncbi:MAG: 1-acyl-sn-glycerol-3-phosphate acyltransferase [Bacteroidales bacterium]|nr:1-acyl-sn-glycerol-3-phosphate acyltransferase [Bacteroidales bacterium]
MKDLILHIYDFLSARKGWAAAIAVLLTGLALLSALRLDLQEDISAFLPKSEESKLYSEVYSRLGEDHIAVIFSGAGTDVLMDAMDAFASGWKEADTEGLVPEMDSRSAGADVSAVLGFVSSNWPYFLLEEDYPRMDSLLSSPGFIRERLQEDRLALIGDPSGLRARYMRTDPLGLFSPVMERLGELNPAGSAARIEDGYLFTPDGTSGIILFDSPFGASESGRNARLSELVDNVKGTVTDAFPEVSVISTGAPVVSAGNAGRIRKDALTALCLAAILICVVLWLSYRRLTDVVWILLSIAAGVLFSLGLIGLFHSSISVIVLGIGSMIAGIAVNYPLHYVDHLKYQSDKRKALAEQVNPLLVGNITTVGAFASLMLLKADALREFGFIGAMTLVGTILFVLVFLPLFIPAAKGPRKAVKLDWDRHIKLGKRGRRLLFAAFCALTLVFAILGRKIGFDADMHRLNYMSREQEEGFATLSSLQEGGSETIYLVQESADAPFLPSASGQKERLERWEAFTASHAGLPEQLSAAAASIGFKADAFEPFLNSWKASWPIADASYFDPVVTTAAKAAYFPVEDGVQIVKRIAVSPANLEQAKADIREKLPSGAFCFSSSDLNASLVRALSEDFDTVGWLCSLIVFFFLCFSFRSLELSLVSFLPLAVGWIWILGGMSLAGLSFNIVNIILASFIFGQGDDYSIFITEGLIYERATGKKILHSYKNAVSLSALIMFIGIGALAIAKHPAMRSLGLLTIVGMICVVLLSYYLPPLVFGWLTRRRDGSERAVPLTIGRALGTLYIGGMMVVSMTILSIWAFLYFLPGKSERRQEKFHRLIQKVASLAIRLIPASHFRMVNPHGEDFSKPAIYICNHQSHFDVLALLALQPKLIFMTNDWVWNFPLYRAILRRAEFYPASWGLSKNSAHIRDLVSRGYSIAIFPEGTRSIDCSIQRFHRGAFLAARELEMDILPLCIHGFGYALPKHDFMLRRAALSLEIGERIRIDDHSEPLTAVARRIRAFYLNWYADIRRDRENAAYCAAWVRYQYLYKGHDATAECRRVLRPSVYREIDALTGPEIEIRDAGCGVYALLAALSHPEIQFTAYEADEDKFLTSSRCALPSNLKYIQG